MLSAITDRTRGEDLPICGSRARRTAAMIEAQIAIVEPKRSRSRVSSSLALAAAFRP
jgi:hypothetical protein